MAVWVVILVMILLLVTMLRQGQTQSHEVSYSQFVTKLEAGQVRSVTIEDLHFTGEQTDGSPFSTNVPAVTDSHHQDQQAVIKDPINYPVFTYPNPITIRLRTGYLPAAGRSRIIRQFLDDLPHAPPRNGRQGFNGL